MDIDLQPPPSSAFLQHTRFRQMSMGSRKRQHSPDAEDRPTKRAFASTHSFAFGGAECADLVARQPSPAGSSHGVPSGASSRFASEDWVQQAGGLSIDSPMFGSANPSRENLVAGGDFDMAMDMEEPSQRPLTRGTSGPFLQVSSASPKALRATLARLQPQINVTPATPPIDPFSHPILAHQPHPQQPSRPFSAASSERMTPMSLSPIQTADHIPAPAGIQSPRPTKPRFTMGPRSDCEKCRLGVKGHWAHFD